MQHVIDYIRQNAATYPREMIDAQLRQVGHSEADIHHAWGSAFAAPVAGSSAAVAVMGGGPGSPIAMAGDGTPWYQSTYMRIVMVIVSIVAAFGAYTEWTDTPDKITGNDIIKQAQKSGGSDNAASAKAALKSISGDVSGKLPSGWKTLKDGMWVDYDNGNSVSVMSTSREGMTVDQIVLGASEALKLRPGVTVKGTKAVQFQGRDALRLKLVQDASDGTSLETTQLYVSHGGDVTIVTVTIGDNGKNQTDEAVSVADHVKLPA